jgi:hypothetical protein
VSGAVIVAGERQKITGETLATSALRLTLTAHIE